jgi:hypothetical protein
MSRTKETRRKRCLAPKTAKTAGLNYALKEARVAAPTKRRRGSAAWHPKQLNLGPVVSRGLVISVTKLSKRRREAKEPKGERRLAPKTAKTRGPRDCCIYSIWRFSHECVLCIFFHREIHFSHQLEDHELG